MRNKFIEIFGWYGMLAILTAYALVSFNYLQVHSLTYQVLNLTGSLGILLVSIKDRAWQPASLNAIWILIALVAVVRLF